MVNVKRGAFVPGGVDGLRLGLELDGEANVK
jgi:hypothetical protein